MLDGMIILILDLEVGKIELELQNAVFTSIHVFHRHGSSFLL